MMDGGHMDSQTLQTGHLKTLWVIQQIISEILYIA